MRNSSNAVRTAGQTPRPLLAKSLDIFRNSVGGDRFGNLYAALREQILAVKSYEDKTSHPRFELLDYGCGNMSFSAKLKAEGLITDFTGMDTFPAPQIEDSLDGKWIHYRRVPEIGIDESMGRYDAAILIDVLHHMKPAEQILLLKAIARVSRYIIVKDHFEYGAISRQILRLADWFGNYAYGVNIPARYFNDGTWSDLIEAASLAQLSITRDVRVHDGLFGLIVPPRSHFFSVLALGI